jgi:hypothetical protein
VPGIINAGRNYTNCLLGCRFGLTEAQRPCGAINLKVSSIVTCSLPLAIRLAVDTDYQHGSNYTTQQASKTKNSPEFGTQRKKEASVTDGLTPTHSLAHRRILPDDNRERREVVMGGGRP